MKTINILRNLIRSTVIGALFFPFLAIAQSASIVSEDNPMKDILSAFHQNDTLKINPSKSDFLLEKEDDSYSKLIRTDKNVVEQNSVVIIDNIDGKKNKGVKQEPSLRISTDFLTDDQFNDSNFQTLSIPNVFTPNNDGINDRFEFPCLELENFNILIFNRWGEMIFLNDKSCSNYWDGKYKNREVTEGVYYYVLNAGKNLRKSGPVVVLR